MPDVLRVHEDDNVIIAVKALEKEVLSGWESGNYPVE